MWVTFSDLALRPFSQIVLRMEENTILQALEALDISVLLKNSSNEGAFDLVINLIKMSNDAEKGLQDYYDYLWGVYANDEPWEKEINKHRPHHSNIRRLKEKLLTFIMMNVWCSKDIPLQITPTTLVDIKSLVYEMWSDNGITFLNSLIERAEGQIDHIEMSGIHGEPLDVDKQLDLDSLVNLRNCMLAIVKEEKERIRQHEEGIRKFEEERDKEESEMLEALQQHESEMTVGKPVESPNVVTVAVTTSD